VSKRQSRLEASYDRVAEQYAVEFFRELERKPFDREVLDAFAVSVHGKVLKVLDLGANSGPHYIALTEDEKRLVISDYFLNEDEAGKVHAEGDHIVHVAKVTNRDLVLDPRFQLNFNTAFGTGPARPHGLAFK
jgi:hypothetical protein